jgi:hypothetical protein
VLLYIAGVQTEIEVKRKMIPFIIITSLIISETQSQSWAWCYVPVFSAPLELWVGGSQFKTQTPEERSEEKYFPHTTRRK